MKNTTNHCIYHSFCTLTINQSNYDFYFQYAIIVFMASVEWFVKTITITIST